MTTSHRWCVFQGEKLLLFLAQGTTIPSENQIVSLLPVLNHVHALGHVKGQLISCAALPLDYPMPLLDQDAQFLPLRQAFELLDECSVTAVIKAYSIVNWDKNHQFCGRCGGTTIRKMGLFERFCPNCTLAFYPRISPSIIVLIRRGDEILMARSPHFLPGVYGLVAGFVEPGETLEDAVHREVKEEVSVNVRSLRYMASQAWPFPDSLMAGFFAEYESGDIIIDHHEIEDAGWYHYDQLPIRSLTRISIARRLIDQFISEVKREKEKKST